MVPPSAVSKQPSAHILSPLFQIPSQCALNSISPPLPQTFYPFSRAVSLSSHLCLCSPAYIFDALRKKRTKHITGGREQMHTAEYGGVRKQTACKKEGEEQNRCLLTQTPQENTPHGLLRLAEAAANHGSAVQGAFRLYPNPKNVREGERE